MFKCGGGGVCDSVEDVHQAVTGCLPETAQESDRLP